MLNWASYPNFTENEFRCPCGCGRADMQANFMSRLQDLRDDMGFPFVVSSGFRCPDHNASVSTTGRSGPHTTGMAADILISGAKAHQLLNGSRTHWFTGIGISQKGPMEKRFIHLDTLPAAPGQPRPTIWSY